MKTVLIVEDEKMIRQGIKTMIQRSGVPVEVIMECNNGQMALDIIREQKIDVMFTDIRMPKMDGIELVKAMQECEHVPLTVAVSGYDDFSYAVEMMRQGVREYLLKPVDRDKIREILEKLNQEIEQNQQKDQEIRSISHQQLKYFMLQENLSQEELSAMVNQFEKLFYTSPYVVFVKERIQKNIRSDSGRSRAKQEEAFEKKERPYICMEELEGRQVFIVEEDKRELLLKNELRNCCAGESLLHQGLTELKMAYQEACAARKLAFCQGTGAVVYNAEKKPGKELVDSRQMHQIAQMIATDKVSEACRIFEKIVWEVKRTNVSIDSFAENMGILMDSIWSTYQNILDMDNDTLEHFRDIFSWSSLEELKEAFVQWMEEFHNKIHQEFDDYKNKHKIQQAIEYIQNNFDQELNMAVVSNMLSMNYSLFSFEFKQYTGKNFVTFLRDIRMEAAKRLLKETDLRIVEISQKVGYENEKHFMKLFKSTCGVSPTEYRKNSNYSGQGSE